MNRRQFFGAAAAAGVSLLTGRRSSASAAFVVSAGAGRIMTVRGPVAAREMGVTLPHEHVLVDFIGAAGVSRDRYDGDEVFAKILPHLQQVKALGCQTLVECTPAYVGRDPALLKRLAAASGLHLLTNTGYYGAMANKMFPDHAHTETADELAARWRREWEEGIEDTGIRPGFIKIGVDAGPLSGLHRKLVVAAARAHLGTGLTIAGHSGNGEAALDQLAVLHEEGVSGRAFIWVHAQSEADSAVHARAAELGAWVEFDGIAPETVSRHVVLVREMKERGYLRQTLISHDAGWYRVGEPGGGKFRPFDTLFTDFLSALRKAGFTEEDIHQLLAENPREAFRIRTRAS